MVLFNHFAEDSSGGQDRLACFGENQNAACQEA